MTESDFGAGYATCLRQFVNHEQRLEGFLAMSLEPSMRLDLWANGASDHLYDLMQPRGISDDERERADALRSRMIHIGHGFAPDSRTTESEIRMWIATAHELLAKLEAPTSTLEEAMRVDRAMGLHPDAGQWACPLDLDKVEAT
jgi:hypothetical protein